MALVVDNVKLPRRTFDLHYSFRVPGESFVAIMGENGSGKSSLLHLISGFETPVFGKIIFKDKPLHRLPPGERPVTILFQDHNLFEHLTLWENIALGLRGTLYLTLEEKSVIENLLEKFQISHLAHKKPNEVSGGEQQRTALARCVLRNKPLLLLDEPFNAIDPKKRYELFDLLRQVRSEYRLTTLIVTHSPQEALHLAPQAIFLHQGQVLFSGPTAEVLSMDHPAIKAFKGGHGMSRLKQAS